jgi:Na+-translocating ferredoxin:NAD+ oxidoreductase RNF subunit RnfB
MILLPIGILLGVGILCAVLLTVAQKFFGMPENEKLNEVREALPGANCGACGYAGCDAYAEALALGKETTTNLCIPGGDGTSQAIASILGLEAADVVEMVAYVACNGSCHPEEKKYIYDGPKSCRAANLSFSGDRNCRFSCLGYGDCVDVCPRDAITITERGVAEIDPQKCIGCGLCAKTCPNHIISLVKDTTRVVVKCSNHYKGAEVRRACLVGCIACGKCEKSCPEGAIKVVDNLATIDYSKCTGCGTCREVCPVHCIHEGNFICGAHFE